MTTSDEGVQCTGRACPAGVRCGREHGICGGRRAWPIMTALGLGDGSGQPGPDPRRARSRALSRLSAMPWA